MGTKIRIENWPSHFESSALVDMLTTVGDVYTCRFEGSTAFVEMVTEMQARDCVQRFHNQPYRGHAMVVRADIARVRKARVAR